MGHQQLLLLTLGIAIVAMTGVITLDFFAEKQENQLYDEITSEAIKVAGDLLAWKMKPAAINGGQDAKYLKGISPDAIGYPSTNKKGTTANTDQYWRSIGGLKSQRPYVTIRPKANGNLRVQLYMYGPSAGCYKLRRSRKIDGTWVYPDMKVGKKKAPAGCTVW